MEKGNSSKHKAKKVKSPPNIASVPVGFAGLFLSIGITLLSIAFDTLDPSQSKLVSAFYFRKAVEPATFLVGIQLFLLILGAVSYLSNFIAIFMTVAPQIRKISDGIGFVLFFLNAYLSLAQTVKMEKEIGNLWNEKETGHLETLISEMLKLHLINLGLMVCLAVQQAISFSSQTPSEDKKKKE